MTGEEIVKRYHTLKSSRSVWESHWQDIAENLIPRRSDITRTLTPGTKTQTKIMNSTPLKCLSRLSAVMHAMLTNTETQWFQILMGQLALNDVKEIKEWLDDVTEIMHLAFYDSNFSMCAPEFFHDLGGICTGIMYTEEGMENILHFKTIPVSQAVVAENPEGFVDTLFRAFTFTARQAVDKWGEENMPDKITKAISDNKPDLEFQFLHAVYPRSERDASSPFAGNMPFASQYIEMETKKVVAEGGYWEFPYAVSRWSKMSGEVYGRGPGEEALPDIKSLYAISKTLLRAGDKVVDPPLDVVEGAYDHAIRTGSTQINWRKANFDPIKPLKLEGNLPYGEGKEEKLKDDIRDTFYITQLQLIDKKQMTLGEVEQRTRENLRILGPTFGRLVFEFFNPLIKRAFGIMQRAGQLPPPPEVLQGKKISIKYQSPLALIQQDQDIQAVIGSMDVLFPMSDKFPEVLDNIDPDKAAKIIMKRKGMPADVIRDDRVVQRIRALRTQAQQEEAQMQAMERGAAVKAAGARGAAPQEMVANG